MLAHHPSSFPALAYPPPASFFLPHARPRSFHDPTSAAAAVDATNNSPSFPYKSAYDAVESPSEADDDYNAHPAHSPEQPSALPTPPPAFHYVPRPSLSAAEMYAHHPHSQTAQHNDGSAHLYATAEQHDQYVQHQESHSRRSPPTLLSGATASASDDPEPYSASPLSSPTDSYGSTLLAGPPARLGQLAYPPQLSAPAHTPVFPQYPGEPRYPFAPTPTLDRRASEPVLGGRAVFAHPAHAHTHDPFTYAPGSPSPRPSSASFSAGYPYYATQQRPSAQQQTQGQPAVAGFDAYAHTQGWGIPKTELEGGEQLAPLSPLYAASAASGSDVSATGLSPRQSPLKPGMETPQQKQQGQPGSRNSKTYSFVSLPGNAVKKRPRRRYDEIERLYQCNWPNCTKAYGTLNHLNAHVTMQKHGSKRSPGEFKELRKQWRQAKKEADDHDRDREREAQLRAGMREAQQHLPHHSQHPPSLHPLGGSHVLDRTRRRLSLGPYPDPHIGYGAPADSLGYALAGPGVSMGAYGQLSPHEVPRYAQDDEMQEMPGMYRQSPAAQHQHPQSQGHLQSQSQGQQGQGQSHHEMLAGQSAWPQSDLRSAGMSLAAATRPMQPFYGGAQGGGLPSIGQLQAQATLSALSATPSAPFPSLGSSILPQPPSPTDLHALQQQHHQQHQHQQHARSAQLHAPRGGLPPNSTLLTAVPAFAVEDDRERDREKEYERSRIRRNEYDDYQ